MNTQKPEAQDKGNGFTLDFHSMFFTIQGEGPFAGHRSIFVRLAGCNLQCPGCDTEYTQGRTKQTILELVHDISELSSQHLIPREPSFPRTPMLVVITGGEPLRQQIGPFAQMLLEWGFRVQIESNGVFAPDPILEELLSSLQNLVWLVVSPKTTRVNAVSDTLACAFKYVLDADSVDPKDGLPIKALEHPASTGVARPTHPHKKIYVNPYDTKDPERNARNLHAAADSCMTHGHILGIQLHKLIGVE